MQVANITGNTIWVEDIDIYLPYKDGEVEHIEPDTLKRSRCLRGFILNGMLEVVAYDKSERIESSLVYLKNKSNTKIEKETQKQEEVRIPDAEPLQECSDDIEVRMHGIFLDAGGYAKVNRNVALKLHQAGVKVKIDPKRSQNQLRETELSPVMPLTKTEISRNHILIDSVIPSFSEMASGKYKVLYTTIESYSVPKQFMDCGQLYDEIWLTSPWSADVLRKNLPDKLIYSIPTGVDHEHYTEDGPQFDLKPNVNKFVFVSVFGWNYRKGYDVLLRSYFDEFSADDDVTLLIVSRYQSGQSRHHKNKIKDDIDKIMEEFPNKDLPHVVRYSRVIPEDDMPKLYRACDCFVLPTRGEGGGLPSLEAAMCGLPVIMTNCSGQQMYLTENNSYMLDIDHLEEIAPGQMHLHYWDGQQFPSLRSEETHNQLRQHMRSVVDNYDEAKRRNRNMQKLIMEKFTWNHTANQALDRLKAIHAKMKE